MTDILLAIIAAIAASASLVLLFVNRTPSALVAFFALWILNQSHYVAFAPGYILTWLVITLIIIALDMMNAIAGHFSRTVVAYMLTGSIAGMLCGIAINPAGLIPGSAIGALLAFLLPQSYNFQVPLLFSIFAPTAFALSPPHQWWELSLQPCSHATTLL